MSECCILFVHQCSVKLLPSNINTNTLNVFFSKVHFSVFLTLNAHISAKFEPTNLELVSFELYFFLKEAIKQQFLIFSPLRTFPHNASHMLIKKYVGSSQLKYSFTYCKSPLTNSVADFEHNFKEGEGTYPQKYGASAFLFCHYS